MIGSVLQADIEQIIRSRNWEELREAFSELNPTDIAEVLIDLPIEDKGIIFRVLPREQAALVFSYLPLDDQEELVVSLSSAQVQSLLNEMTPDDRTRLLEELPAEVTRKLLETLSPDVVLTGLTLTAHSLWQMTHFSLGMSAWPLITSGIVQGLGLGFVFIPLSTVAFRTLPPMLRTEASALFNLVRNIGSSIGISIMAAMLATSVQTNHATLSGYITQSNTALTAAGIDPAAMSAQTATAIDGLINVQALMIGYLNDFRLMMWITIAAAPLLLLLRYKRDTAPTHQAIPAAAMAE